MTSFMSREESERFQVTLAQRAEDGEAATRRFFEGLDERRRGIVQKLMGAGAALFETPVRHSMPGDRPPARNVFETRQTEWGPFLVCTGQVVDPPKPFTATATYTAYVPSR